MELYTRTYTALDLQLAQFFGIPLPARPHSTLNEKLGIQAGASLGTNELPTAGWLVVGIGGHASTPGIDNIPLIENKIHRSRDTGLFRITPLVLRPVGNDLDDIQRAKFGLRRIENHGGNDYIAYYAMAIDKSGLQIKLQDRVIDNNQDTELSDFIPVSDDLSPIPVDLANGGTNTVAGKYISSSVSLTIPFTPFHAEEFLNVVQILYGNEQYGTISEASLVSGVTRSVSVSDGAGGTVSFNEIIHAQVAAHVPVIQPVFSQRNGFDITAEIGGIEALLNIELATP